MRTLRTTLASSLTTTAVAVALIAFDLGAQSAAAPDDDPVVLAASEIGTSCTPLEGGGIGCGPASSPALHPADPTWQLFAEAQQADGSWGPTDVPPSARVSTTALVLWSFTNLGYCPRAEDDEQPPRHPFTETTLRAQQFLESMQELTVDEADRGRIGDPGTELLAHIFATLALVDLAAITGDPTLSARAELALDHLVARQSSDGTWPEAESATVSAWASYALGAAVSRGLPLVPDADSAREAARETAIEAARRACRRRVDAFLADASSTDPVPLATLASVAVLSLLEPAEGESLSTPERRALAERLPRDVAESGSPEARLWSWLAARTLPGESRAPGLASKLSSHAMNRRACLAPLTAPCDTGPFGGALDGAALAQILLGSVLRYEPSMGELRAGFP